MPSNEVYKYGLLAGLGLGTLIEYPNMKLAYHTLGRDMRAFSRLFGILRKSTYWKRNKVTWPQIFAETCTKDPEKVGGTT